MTREEAIDLLNDGLYNNEEVLSKIYDDFESRTCKNCKHMKTLGHFYVCHEMYHHDIFTTTKDFGCNKFERKTNGDV